MRSSVCFITKSERARLINKYLNEQRQFVDNFLTYGPWQIDWDRFSQIKPDRTSGANIFQAAATNSNNGEFQVYRSNSSGKYGNIVFFVWKKEHKVNFKNFPDFNVIWKAAIAPLAARFPAFDLAWKKIAALEIGVALFGQIKSARSCLPSRCNVTGYGLCLREPENFMDLKDDLTDYGSPGSSRDFIVYSATISRWQEDQWKDERIAIMPETIKSWLLDGDYNRCRVPRLSENILTDNTQGHWDLYWPGERTAPEKWYAKAQLDSRLVARDPLKDIVKASVAIDFGTSSTVVAMRGQRGGVSLLRVGAQPQDMRGPVKPCHFENPTILNFDNAPGLLEAWRSIPYKPAVKWENAQCSHEARAESARKIRGCFPRLKTWACGKPGDSPQALTDPAGNELIICVPSVQEKEDFVEGLENRPLNPIELYAFFLGVTLNNQIVNGGRIFTDYYMTFPVKFDRETRSRILSGFRVGLLRSLPPSLAYAPEWNPEKLKVRERANEPSALAAAILPLLDRENAVVICETPQGHTDEQQGRGEKAAKDPAPDEKTEQQATKAFVPILPTRAGVPFGVFDFGGGTADFAIGLYRLPTCEELDDEGWEKVVEILDASGDKNLGGENLVQHLAFEVVKSNMPKLLEKEVIPFMAPADAPHVPGGEELFAASSIAHGNSSILGERLRPLWEGGEIMGKGDLNKAEGDEMIQLRQSLVSVSGNPVDIDLDVDQAALKAMLKNRVHEGVISFFTTFCQAFKGLDVPVNEFHIILGGNSCKSPLVMECFREEARAMLRNDGESPGNDKIFIYPPILPDDANPEATTLKTGVAIGLLSTLDGEPIGIVERRSSQEEANFAYALGPAVDGVLVPAIRRNDAYGEWRLFGKLRRHGKAIFLYSTSPLATEGQIRRGGPDCVEDSIEWNPEHAGKSIVVMPVKPDTVKFGLRDENGNVSEEREVVLES